MTMERSETVEESVRVTRSGEIILTTTRTSSDCTSQNETVSADQITQVSGRQRDTGHRHGHGHDVDSVLISLLHYMLCKRNKVVYVCMCA